LGMDQARFRIRVAVGVGGTADVWGEIQEWLAEHGVEAPEKLPVDEARQGQEFWGPFPKSQSVRPFLVVTR